MAAIDAFKRAQLEADACGLDPREDHRTRTCGTAVGLNRYAAGMEQGSYRWHDAQLYSDGNAAELSATGYPDRCGQEPCHSQTVTTWSILLSHAEESSSAKGRASNPIRHPSAPATHAAVERKEEL